MNNQKRYKFIHDFSEYIHDLLNLQCMEKGIKKIKIGFEPYKELSHEYKVVLQNIAEDILIKFGELE